MPIYEYVCSECNSAFEELRPISAADKDAECPKCHKPAKRKMSTLAAFSASLGGVPKTVPGAAGGSACSSCSSGDCSTCAS
jgi:putative FmdB family regulatory protein